MYIRISFSTLEMKIPSSVGSKGFPAWPLAPPRILMPSFSPGCFWMEISCNKTLILFSSSSGKARFSLALWRFWLTCIPGGDGSLRTNIRISCLLANRARTASWCVAWRKSMVFTSNIRSPTRSPLWHARPWGITWQCHGTFKLTVVQ